MSKFGNFGDFCRDSTLPVCNLFNNRDPQTCVLMGFTAVNGHRIQNLGMQVVCCVNADFTGDTLLCGIALAVTLYLFYITERRKAAVGSTL